MTNSDRSDKGSVRGAAELYRFGSEALEAKEYARAQRLLLAALEKERKAEHLSQYALALAQQKGDLDTCVKLCQEAIRKDPKNPEHFLRLGTVYLLAGRRKEAIRIFQLGLRVGRHPQIVRWLDTLGRRKARVLPFLSRSHPLNKCLGKLRMSLSKRK